MRTQPEADDFRICQVLVWTSYVGIGNPTMPSIRNCRITTLRSPSLSETSPVSPDLLLRPLLDDLIEPLNEVVLDESAPYQTLA